jgi:hypothetical protein
MTFITLLSLLWQALFSQAMVRIPGPGGAISAVGSNPWVTSSPSGATARNDLTGCVGAEFTVGSASITVTSVGRWVISGNSQTHNVYIVLASAPTVTVVSGAVNTLGAGAGAFAYQPVIPTTLAASTSYYIESQETNGGDQWYDSNGSAYTVTSDASLVQPGYFIGASCPGGLILSGAPSIYVPSNFKYHL